MVQERSENLQGGDTLRRALILLLLALQLSFGQLLDRVVANVNGEPILESELRIASLFYNIKDREKLIEMLVEKHLVAQFLFQQGLNIPEDYIDQLIRNIADSNGKSVEELYEELRRENLTLEDLRNFLKIEVASTLGLREYLSSRIDVSEVEIELERLKHGEVEFLKEIELLVVSGEEREKLLKLIGEVGSDLENIAKALGTEVERLKVKRGDLVEALEREVWKAEEGDLVVAEEGDKIYLARVIRTVRVISGRSEDEIREEILNRKMEEERRKIIGRLRKESFIQILG